MTKHFCGMGWRACLVIGAAAMAGCTTLVVVSPHDPVIDNGLQDFKEKLNLLVMDAGSKTAPEGSFDAYKKGYLELEIKLVMLRQRAAILEADDTSCDVSPKLKGLVEKMPKGPQVLQAIAAASPSPVDDKAPVPISPLAIGKRKDLPAAVGCMTHLIDNVAGQLTAIEGIHSNPAHCAAEGQPTATCMRPATAAAALALANDSLDAALLVQIYKKERETSK